MTENGEQANKLFDVCKLLATATERGKGASFRPMFRYATEGEREITSQLSNVGGDWILSQHAWRPQQLKKTSRWGGNERDRERWRETELSLIHI